MFYAYMIKSESSRRRYYEHASNLEKRLVTHNSSQNRYTHGKGPWILKGYKECQSKSEALKIEQTKWAMGIREEEVRAA